MVISIRRALISVFLDGLNVFGNMIASAIVDQDRWVWAWRED